MPTTIITPSQDAIVSEIQIAAPAKRVFKALTDASELQRWFTGPECPVKFWKMDRRPLFLRHREGIDRSERRQ
jgi:uncharacterized protein YndB with AHSA1/START domain